VGHRFTHELSVRFAELRARDDEPLATAKLVSVCVSANSQAPIRVPDSLRDAVAAFESRSADDL